MEQGSLEAGLLPDLTTLDGPSFAASDLHPDVRHFYEHTAAWRMDAWTAWSAAFAPFGALIERLFGRRVQQLAIPVSPLDSARGLDSRIATITDGAGHQVAAAWLRTLRATGGYLYSGHYTTGLLPGSEQPVVHVTFPLESGNIQVFLRPSAGPDGSLRLISPDGSFGDPGAYAVVDEPAGRYASRLPIHESFHVYPDADEPGVVRTDHDLRLWTARVLRLHYRMQRSGDSAR